LHARQDTDLARAERHERRRDVFAVDPCLERREIGRHAILRGAPEEHHDVHVRMRGRRPLVARREHLHQLVELVPFRVGRAGRQDEGKQEDEKTEH
jgi:hypothetical protein